MSFKNKILENLDVLFDQVETTLNDYNGKDTLKFPALVGMMGIRLGWKENEAKINDPLIRYYIKNHPEWKLAQGAKGGIIKVSDLQKKVAAKSAKTDLKNKIRAEIEAKVESITNDEEISESPDIEEFEDFDTDV